MKYAIGLLFSLLLSHSVFAVKIKQAGVVLSRATDTVHVDFKNEMPLVKVKLGKKGKFYTFLIDTGAPTAISEEIADLINAPVDFEQSMNALKETKSTVTFVRVDSLLAGETTFKNLTAFVWNNKETRILSCLGIDGILGSNALNGVHHQMNWRAGQIIFADKAKRFAESHTEHSVKVHYVGVQKAPYLYSDKPRLFFLLDTGFNGYMDVSALYHKELLKKSYANQINATYGNTSEGAFGISAPDTVFSLQLDSFRLAGLIIPKLVADTEEGVSSKIGNELMENYVLTFNPKRKKLWFKPHERQNHLPEYRFGLSFFPINDTVRIASLDTHPPHGAEVLKTGMIVISANGYTFKQGNEMGCEWLAFIMNDIKAPDLTTLKLEVEDPETREIRTVVVERYPAPLYK
jgi:predicted aspartyl protease